MLTFFEAEATNAKPVATVMAIRIVAGRIRWPNRERVA
jgi:hypothetical protein